jgi:CheY-like chemotaxis protein
MASGRRRAGRSRPLVLIVDDDAIVAEAAADAIVAAGYRATCAHDGWQALAALDHEQPAVMLVDLLMPGMSGSELLRRVKERPAWSHIRCVIMTGTNDPMIRVREDAPVFYKPVDLESLVQVIGRYCDPVIGAHGVASRRAPAP